MEKLILLIIKNLIKTFLEMYFREIVIYGFIIVETITNLIVLWETFTGKNLVDVIADLLATETDLLATEMEKSQTNAPSMPSDRFEEI